MAVDDAWPGAESTTGPTPAFSFLISPCEAAANFAPLFLGWNRHLRPTDARERDPDQYHGGASGLRGAERLAEEQDGRQQRDDGHQVRVDGRARAADLADRGVPDRVRHAEREQRRVDDRYPRAGADASPLHPEQVRR